MIADALQFSIEKSTPEGRRTFALIVMVLAAILIWAIFKNGKK
jgi:hypothetical protein